MYSTYIWESDCYYYMPYDHNYSYLIILKWYNLIRALGNSKVIITDNVIDKLGHT